LLAALSERGGAAGQGCLWWLVTGQAPTRSGLELAWPAGGQAGLLG